MSQYETTFFPETIQLMMDKGISVSKLSKLAEVGESTIYRMRTKKAVITDTGNNIINILKAMKDAPGKKRWAVDKPEVSKKPVYIAEIGENIHPDSIGNIIFPGRRSPTRFPCEKSEAEIDRMHQYLTMMGRK